MKHVHLPGKGVGMLAVQDISAGTLLLRDRFLLRLTPDGEGRFDGVYGGDRDRCRALLATLSPDGKKTSGSILERVIEANGFVVENGAATVIFESASADSTTRSEKASHHVPYRTRRGVNLGPI